ncbi:hypothetical protein CR513_01790, partial [Mucuna pruriens]
MEFNDNLVQFNIFEAMKHPIEDPSLFSIDVIDKLVAEYMQLEIGNAEFSNFAEDIHVISCLGFVIDESDYDKLLEVQDLSDSEDDIVDLANLDLNSELVHLIDQVCKNDEEHECSKRAKAQVAETKKLLQAQVATIIAADQKQQNAETKLANQVLNLDRVGQLKPIPTNEALLLHSPLVELKPLSGHLKYAYLNNGQQFLVIIANNLHQEEDEKLLQVLRQHKKAIRWRLFDLPRINPSICMYKILMKEEARPIRQ